MKRPGIDTVGVLLRKEAALRIERMQAPERLTGLTCLARRKPLRNEAVCVVRSAPRVLAPREEMCRTLRGEKTRLVRGPFVGELATAGERLVNHESRVICKDGPKHAGGRKTLDRPVEHLLEVGRDEVNAIVRRVARRGHGRGVGGPHRRCAATDPEKKPSPRRGVRDALLVRSAKAEAPKRGQAGTVL